MAIILGVSINWRLSPRVITIPIAEKSITVEDLQDTLLDLEAKETDGMLFPHIRNTSGGEALGGGVTVGWTIELQDAVIAFTPRTASQSSGTATTANAAGTQLKDNTATFITDGIVAGATIINFSDKSVTSVISVDSEIQLTHYPLDDGIDNDWGIGDSYKVWNEIQCEITGGNTVAVDLGDSVISPVRPTFGTQVLKVSSSSATTQELTAIQFSSYNNRVTVQFSSPYSGESFPVGTREQPVNNLADALLILTNKGLNKIEFIGNATIDSNGVYDGIVFIGESKTKSVLIISSGASVIGCEFTDTTLTGTLDGNSKLDNCRITTLNFVDGIVEDCILAGIITLSGTSDAHFIDCKDGIIGLGKPEIDCGGSGSGLNMKHYSGDIKITNKTGAEYVEIDILSGSVELTNTVTDGTIVVKGNGALIDNSGFGATVISTDLIQPFMLRDIHDEALGKWTVDPTGKTLTLYRIDGTVLKTFNLGDTTANVPSFISRNPV